MLKDAPQVAAVILNWNNYDDSADCIKSLQTLSYPAIDLFVVDNGSLDGSGERLDDEFPEVDVLYTDENLGFSGGMNYGIRHILKTNPVYIWLLNNDVVIPRSDVLDQLVKVLEANKEIGVVTPLIKYFPETDRVLFRKAVVNYQNGNTKHISGAVDENELLYNDYVPYCSALIRSDILEDTGLLPEEYFLYYEDVDHCTQIRQKNHKIVTAPRVWVAHKKEVTSTFKSPGFVEVYYRTRNIVLYIRKYDMKSHLFLAYYIYWIGLQIIFSIVSRDTSCIVALVRGVVDGFRGVEGQGPYP